MIITKFHIEAGLLQNLNNKSQITNHKQITMTKIQNPKLRSYTPFCGSSLQDFVLVIVYWNLRFICNLVLVIWDFKTISRIN